MSEVALVFGMGVSGEAVARHLRDRGARIVVADDRPGEAARARAETAGFELVEAPTDDQLRRLVAEADVVVPTPAIPETHPLFDFAAEAGTPVRSEVELAWRWTRKPIVAVTGTNGKTTVTELITAMLVASGVDALAAGNIGLPLAEAVRRSVDVLVAEVSSFQLASTDSFHPKVAVWLNFAADHLDWHVDMDSYAAAKARIWSHQDGHDTAVVNADDPVVMKWAAKAPSHVLTFGLGSPAATDYVARDGALHGPFGPILPVEELPRAQPHDLANSLAAAAAAWAAGATEGGIAQALRTFRSGAHRVAFVAEHGGIRWYNDSKATNPHATAAAVNGFDSVVLIAGGRNKGLDLRALAAGVTPRVRAVVALGEAGPDVAAAFEGLRPVTLVATMQDAVRAAAAVAQPGDVVLLSPACASFDLYRSYAERGDDFVRTVRALAEEAERATR